MTCLTIGFDLDQTLIDSRARIVGSFRSAFRSMGLDDVAPSAFDPWFGHPLDVILEAVSPGADMTTFEPAYRHAYDVERPAAAEAMPGARAALEWLQDKGFRVMVVSAKNQRAVEVGLEEAGIAALVDVAHGDLFGENKAVPLREAGADLYVGDHVADMHAARLSGARGIGVTTGAHDEAALREAGAATVVPDLTALPGVVESLLPAEA